MSVRKYARQPEGHYEKICLLSESDKYPSKSHQTAVHNDLLASKERISPHGSNNSSSNRRSDYLSSQNKNNSVKSSYANSSQRHRDNGSPSTDRHNSSSHSSRHNKVHDNNDDDNFEWTTHISSSGKTYYYNRRNEKSQWEKPKEWIERENKMRAREREKRIRESGGRDPKESSKYPKLSPFKKEYISSSRNSPYAKRNHELTEVERPKSIQTHGAITVAASTASSRSSDCPTPEATGSPIGSVQDISPPSTPSNSTVSSLSPFINSSTSGNHVTSPHLFTNSPGLSSVAHLNPHSPHLSSPVSHMYQNKYTPSDRKMSGGGGSSLQGSQNSSLSGHGGSSQGSSEGTPSTAALHPLQQAMLLRQSQQQQQQLVAQQSLYGNPSGQHLAQSPYGQLSSYTEQKHRSEAGPPPPPPQHLEKTATPPPPPPPSHVDHNQMMPGGYNISRYRDPRTANMKPTYMQSYETPYPGYGTDNGGWENSNQKTVVREAPVPELPDLNSFSQFCCKKAFEDVAGWMGCILERQASMVCNEVDSCLGLLAERSKSNLVMASLASCVTDARQQVVSSRQVCVKEVLTKVEGLQDLRIERQDSKSKRGEASSSDSRTVTHGNRADRRESKS